MDMNEVDIDAEFFLSMQAKTFINVHNVPLTLIFTLLGSYTQVREAVECM